MNKRKYMDSFYEPRKIEDLRELINSSVKLHNNRPAFLVKDKPGGNINLFHTDSFPWTSMPWARLFCTLD